MKKHNKIDMSTWYNDQPLHSTHTHTLSLSLFPLLVLLPITSYQYNFYFTNWIEYCYCCNFDKLLYEHFVENLILMVYIHIHQHL